MWFALAYLVLFVGTYVYDYWIGIDECADGGPPVFVMAMFSPISVPIFFFSLLEEYSKKRWEQRRAIQKKRRQEKQVAEKQRIAAEQDIERAFQELENEDQSQNQRHSVSDNH